MSEWQPIETAPKDGTYVLVYTPGMFSSVKIASFRCDDYREEEGPMWLENDFDDFSTSYASTPVSASHWMPLPEPPK